MLIKKYYVSEKKYPILKLLIYVMYVRFFENKLQNTDPNEHVEMIIRLALIISSNIKSETFHIFLTEEFLVNNFYITDSTKFSN